VFPAAGRAGRASVLIECGLTRCTPSRKTTYLRRRGIRCTIPDKTDQGRATVRSSAPRAVGNPIPRRPTTASAKRSSARSPQETPRHGTRYDRFAVPYETTHPSQPSTNGDDRGLQVS
jgi:hypothetical protein